MKNSQDLILNIVKKPASTPQLLKPINTLQEIFSFQPATADEKEQFFIELNEIIEKNIEDQEKLKKDLHELVHLSKECNSIQKQGIVLLGEKIHRTKEIFSAYKEFKSLFTHWIKKTFSSEKTAYNALSFFELHQEFSNEDREKLKKMPLKASYALASRKGDIEKKRQIVQEKYELASDEILDTIRNVFPLAENDLRKNKSSINQILQKMEGLLLKLQNHPEKINNDKKNKIKHIRRQIADLIEELK